MERLSLPRPSTTARTPGEGVRLGQHDRGSSDRLPTSLFERAPPCNVAVRNVTIYFSCSKFSISQFRTTYTSDSTKYPPLLLQHSAVSAAVSCRRTPNTRGVAYALQWYVMFALQRCCALCVYCVLLCVAVCVAVCVVYWGCIEGGCPATQESELGLAFFFLFDKGANT